jgi:copper(I)-binding protein
MKRLILILLFLPFFANAENIIIHDINVRKAISPKHPTTIYLSIDNLASEIDYLLEVEVNGFPATIRKTVIEKNIARIIKIDRLGLPAKSTVFLVPMGIYIVVNYSVPDPIRLKLTFNNAGVIYKQKTNE